MRKILIGLLILIITPLPSFADIQFKIIQITDNELDDQGPVIYNDNIAWANNNGIWYWDGISILHVSDLIPHANQLSMSSDLLCWTFYDGDNYELYIWDGVIQ